uniref:Uncharacterized protein n=1 Tax=Rhizophora mucronata TaxID=61149 RepID=A0A2P2PN49_RHIMU
MKRKISRDSTLNAFCLIPKAEPIRLDSRIDHILNSNT